MDNTINNRPKERKGGKRKTAAVDPVDMPQSETTEPQPPPAATPAASPPADNDAAVVAQFASQNGINLENPGVIRTLTRIIMTVARFFKDTYVNHRREIDNAAWIAKQFGRLVAKIARFVLSYKWGSHAMLALGLGLADKLLYEFSNGKSYIWPIFVKAYSFLVGFNHQSTALVPLQQQLHQCIANLTDAIYYSLRKDPRGTGFLYLNFLSPAAKEEVINLLKNKKFKFEIGKEDKNEPLLLDFAGRSKAEIDQIQEALKENETYEIPTGALMLSNKALKDFSTRLSTSICTAHPLKFDKPVLPSDVDPSVDPEAYEYGRMARGIANGIGAVLATALIAGAGYYVYRAYRKLTAAEEKRKDDAYERVVQRLKPKPARTEDEFYRDVTKIRYPLSEDLKAKIRNKEMTPDEAWEQQNDQMFKIHYDQWQREVMEAEQAKAQFQD